MAHVSDRDLYCNVPGAIKESEMTQEPDEDYIALKKATIARFRDMVTTIDKRIDLVVAEGWGSHIVELLRKDRADYSAFADLLEDDI
jgi:hypothetical protein